MGPDDVAMLIGALDRESDRAAIILGSAQLDVGLRALLRSALLPCPNARDDLLGDVEGGDAPLATFSSRIHACYRLGLIDAGFAHTLHLLRKIRNEFAHSSQLTASVDEHGDRLRALLKPFRVLPMWQQLARFYGNLTPAKEIRAAMALMIVLVEARVDRTTTLACNAPLTMTP